MFAKRRITHFFKMWKSDGNERLAVQNGSISHLG